MKPEPHYPATPPATTRPRRATSRPASLLLLTALFACLYTPAMATSSAPPADELETRVERRVVVVRGESGEGRVVLGGPSMSRTFLGVQLVSLSPELCEHFGVPMRRAVMVSSVTEDSPATAAGLRVGDVILRIDGEPAGTAAHLAQSVAAREPGETVTLEVRRDGETLVREAILGQRDRAQIDVGPLLWHWEGKAGDSPPFSLMHGAEGEIELEVETLDSAMEHLQQQIHGPRLEGRMRFFQENGSALLGRLEELEQRLLELETELDCLPEEKR